MKRNHTVSSCLWQAFTGISFLLAIVGIILALCIGGFPAVWSAFDIYKSGLLDYGIHFTILKTALQSNAVCFMMPVFCTFPFTASFLEDLGCGFLKSYLPRAGRDPYIAGKILATGFSGGMVPVIGIIIYYNLLRLLLLPMEKYPEVEMTFGKNVCWSCVLFFLAGMVFSMVGMLLSILTSNRYMAYASPFVLEYVLIILHERYLKKLFIIDPKEWIDPTGEWILGGAGAAIFLLLVALLITVILIPVMLGRISEL